VGGASSIPAVQDRLEDFFAFEPYMTNDLDWIVAYGAAIAADIDDDVATLYQCPVPDCDETNEGVTLVFDHIVDAHGTDSCPYPGCDKDPGSEDDLKSHLAGEHSKDIATTTTQDDGTKEIKKTIQRSYGTDVGEDRMHIIVPNGTELPAEGSAMFTTAQDNQTKVPVDVFQGENEDDRYENEQLHTWEITDLPKMDAREPDIEVTFEIDEDDILTVTAEEKKSGTKATTQISTEMSVNTSDSPRKTEADD
jgi:molecular chaperone DnaK (HSP70)